MRSSIGRGRRPVVLSFMLAFATVAMVGVAPVAAGGGPLTIFEFELNDGCVHGYNGPASTELKLTLRGPQGGFQGSRVVLTDSSGNWSYVCFHDDISAGDQLTAKFGSNTRTLVVPKINFSTNRATDVVSGTTAPNSDIRIYLRGCQSDWSCDNITNRDKTTNAKGKFSTDFTSLYNVRGHDQVEVDLFTAQGDIIYRGIDVPSMEVGTYYNEVYGTAKPNTDVTVWLFDKMGNQVAKARDHSDWWDGEYGTVFGRDIQPKMYVSSDIASDALWQVKDFDPTFNTGTDTVGGTCWSNRPWYIDIQKQDNSDYFSAEGVTDGSGDFSVTTTDTSAYDLESGDNVRIYCRNHLGDDQESLFEVP